MGICLLRANFIPGFGCSGIVTPLFYMRVALRPNACRLVEYFYEPAATFFLICLYFYHINALRK